VLLPLRHFTSAFTDGKAAAGGVSHGLLHGRHQLQRNRCEQQRSPCAGGDQRQPSKRQRSYAPQLTASSYKYFLRGTNSKATQADFVVKARSRAKLREYDHLLKQFRYNP
jgi:hypothetical protein